MLRRGLIAIGIAVLCCPAGASAHDDWRTLTAEARRAPGPEGWLTLRCGGHEERTALPVTEEWIRITVADRGKRCKAGHRGAGEIRALELTRGRHELPIRGADVSSLAKSEDFGGVYRTARGRQRRRARHPQDQRPQLDPAAGLGRPRRRLPRHGASCWRWRAGPRRWASRCWSTSTTPTSGPTPASSGRRRPGRACRSTRSSDVRRATPAT